MSDKNITKLMYFSKALLLKGCTYGFRRNKGN